MDATDLFDELDQIDQLIHKPTASMPVYSDRVGRIRWLVTSLEAAELTIARLTRENLALKGSARFDPTESGR